jgi:ABC-type glutathione transport system ATPase component
MEKLLEVRNLKVIFQLDDTRIEAVREASFDLGAGEVLVLAGESGSGKTVTALTITRILPRNSRIVSGSVN